MIDIAHTLFPRNPCEWKNLSLDYVYYMYWEFRIWSLFCSVCTYYRLGQFLFFHRVWGNNRCYSEDQQNSWVFAMAAPIVRNTGLKHSNMLSNILCSQIFPTHLNCHWKLGLLTWTRMYEQAYDLYKAVVLNLLTPQARSCRWSRSTWYI